MGDESGQKFLTVKWCIENLSCWNFDIHGAFILHKELVIDRCESKFRLSLYPKGESGDHESFVVHVYDSNQSIGELAFISSDGLVLSKIEIKEQEWDSKNEIVLYTKLQFEKVVSNLVKKHLHKDVFTLQYRRSNDIEEMYSMCSQIDIIDNFLEIPFERFKNFPWPDECSATLQLLAKDKYQILTFRADTDSSDSGEIRFSLEIKDKDVFFIQCYIYTLNSDDILLKSKKYEHVFSKVRSWQFPFLLPSENVIKKGLYLFLRLKFITGIKRERYIFNEGHFKITNQCFSEVSDGLNDSLSNPENAATVLRKELMCLYQDQEHSDFELRCGNVALSAHKGILSTRSPVFKSMLSSNMKEAESCCLEIVDLDVHTLGRFLTFLYTGTVEEDLQWEDACKLYYAADKYQVPSLKKECFTVLSSGLSVTNVCYILSLADKHQDNPLTSIAQDFILDNYYEVLKSKEWKGFMEKDALLLCKTITFLSEKQYLGKILVA